jgi:hypothetical protein
MVALEGKNLALEGYLVKAKAKLAEDVTRVNECISTMVKPSSTLKKVRLFSFTE